MRQDVNNLIDRFVDETLINAQFLEVHYHQRSKLRIIRISNFLNTLIHRVGLLTTCDEPAIKKLIAKLHRVNYKSTLLNETKQDREYFLREFEKELFGNDNTFLRVHQKAYGDYVDGKLDKQLVHVLQIFSVMKVSFVPGDYWRFRKKIYRVCGRFAFSDIWFLLDMELVRLKELLPLNPQEFEKIDNARK